MNAKYLNDIESNIRLRNMILYVKEEKMINKILYILIFIGFILFPSTLMASIEDCGQCDGKINNLTLQYNGEKSALIEVYGHKKDLVFKDAISKSAFMLLNGFDKKNTLGPKINIYIDGIFNTSIHTSCSVELLVGMEFGSFTIRDGSSRNGGEICTISEYKDVGHLCGLIYEDKNLNNIQDSDENADTSISLTVVDAMGESHKTSPDENGNYCIYTIAEGLATVTVDENTLPDGTLLIDGENPNFITVMANSIMEAGTDTYTYAEPEAFDSNITTLEDTPVNLILRAEDKDDRTLAYVLLTQPKNGTISGIAPNLTYVPNINYNGNDSFTFKVNNGTLDSKVAVVNIDIQTVNDIPIAYEQTLTLQEDLSKIVMLSGVDIEKDVLTYFVVTQPTHGVLSGTVPNIFYIPNKNYHGKDSFTFKVNDGMDDSLTADITLNVLSVNDTPKGVDDNAVTDEDTQVSIDVLLNDSDIDGTLDSSTLNITTQPINGTVVVDSVNSKLIYTPNSNYYGSDTLQYTVKDNEGVVSNSVNVGIEVKSVNDLPIANDQNITLNEDTFKLLLLTATDSDDRNLTYSIVTQSTHGVLSGSIPSITYTPNANYYGSDSFTFKVNDSKVDSAVAKVSINVLSVNDAPVVEDRNITLNEDTSKLLVLTATDSDDDNLTYNLVAQPTHGVLSGDAPNLTYTPNANFYGSDSFTFKVNDSKVDSVVAKVSIEVTHNNVAPIAINQTVTTYEDIAVSVVLKGTDSENDRLEYIIVTQPTNGTISGTDDNITYTPNVNYSGNDSFTFKVNDGVIDSSIATVIIQVLSSDNNTPVAYNQYIITSENSDTVIKLKADDADGDTLEYILLTQPKTGLISGTVPNITYTPKKGNTGLDCFTFKVNDGREESSVAVISVQKISQGASVQKADITMEEFAVYLRYADQTYIQKIIADKPSGNLDTLGISYSFSSALNSYGYGAIYFTLNNTQNNDLTNFQLFFLTDIALEQKTNTFFNEYGALVKVDGVGSGDLNADYWQIDEPDYLSGHLIENLNKGFLDQTNHIKVGSPDDTAMALGFDIDYLKSGESLSFKIELSPENIGGLLQIDAASGSEIFYNVTLQKPSMSTCQ